MNKFKLAHAIAKVLKGDYSARMAYAWQIIKADRLHEVSELLDVETLTPKMYVSEYPYATAKKADQMPKKVRIKSKNTKKSKKVQPIEEPAQKIVHTAIPENLATVFTAQQCAAIDEIITNYVYGKMDKRTGKRNNGANELEGEHMDMARFRYNDGIEALKNIKGATFPMSYTNAKGDEVEYDYTPFMQLQTAMVTYFLRDYVKMTVKRFLDMGLNFKQLEQVQAMASIEAKQSYMMASSNRGNIVAFDIDDIMDEFVFDSMRLTFSETMFDSADDAVKVCFMRLKNVMRVQLRKLRNQTLVVTEQQMYVQEEGVSRSTEEEALQMAKEMGIFSDAEMEIIRLRLEGFKKVEIDKQVGKRTDRDFKRIEKAYNAAV